MNNRWNKVENFLSKLSHRIHTVTRESLVGRDGFRSDLAKTFGHRAFVDWVCHYQGVRFHLFFEGRGGEDTSDSFRSRLFYRRFPSGNEEVVADSRVAHKSGNAGEGFYCSRVNLLEFFPEADLHREDARTRVVDHRFDERIEEA